MIIVSQLLSQLISHPEPPSSDAEDCVEDMPEVAASVTVISSGCTAPDLHPASSPPASIVSSPSSVLRFIDSQQGVRSYPLGACCSSGPRSQPEAEALRLRERLQACVSEVLQDPDNVFILMGCRW